MSMHNGSIPTHVSTEASPADRGRAFGAAQADLVANTVAAYRRLFAARQNLGRRQIENLGQHVADRLHLSWPGLAEEIAAIADGARVDELELFAANARTEILAGAGPPECSVIGVLPGRPAAGRLLLAQNWDWHPELANSRVLWTVVEPDGNWFTTLTEAGLLAKIGLNGSGLGVMLNILSCSLDGGVDGVPIHVLLRLVLQRCGDVPSAIRLIQDARMSGSSCLTLAGRDGGDARLVSAEISPAGPAFVPPTEGILLHTNHFQAGPLRGRDLYRQEWPDTLARLDNLRELLNGVPAITAEMIQQALRSHTGGPLSVCCHGEQAANFADQSATLASVVLDLDTLEMTVAPGQPCQHPYEALLAPASADG
jgi:isopenicillin-N N-acyltransferase-like protein